jgi:signal transduction histidine kinase
MRGLPLRLRVALAAAVGVLLAVAGLAAAAQYLVHQELQASQDRALRSRATDVARLSVSAPALLTAPGALDAASGGQDLLVEVLDRHGRIVARSGALGGRLLPTGALLNAAIRRGQTGYGRGDVSGGAIRVFAAPLPDAGGVAAGGAVIVAASAGEVVRTADRVRTLILLSALAAAALGGLVAALLTGRGLAPLRRLVGAAGEIERTGDPARRLPEDGAGEIGDLTRTLNAMLASLEDARRGERRFLADASHELRTPVTALRGNVAYLARHGADPETVADLRADVDRLARLVDDLLALERQTQAPAERAPVALHQVARDAAAAAGAGVRVAAVDGVWVQGDGDALRRALDNLIANALTHGAPPVVVTVGRAGDRARVAVADGGPGLGAEDARVAFDRFWRGARSGDRPGTGLGLAIVRATARAHGGDVTVDGATFTLDLPAGAPPATIVRDPSEPPPSVNDVPLTT